MVLIWRTFFKEEPFLNVRILEPFGSNIRTIMYQKRTLFYVLKDEHWGSKIWHVISATPNIVSAHPNVICCTQLRFNWPNYDLCYQL